MCTATYNFTCRRSFCCWRCWRCLHHDGHAFFEATLNTSLSLGPASCLIRTNIGNRGPLLHRDMPRISVFERLAVALEKRIQNGVRGSECPSRHFHKSEAPRDGTGRLRVTRNGSILETRVGHGWDAESGLEEKAVHPKVLSTGKLHALLGQVHATVAGIVTATVTVMHTTIITKPTKKETREMTKNQNSTACITVCNAASTVLAPASSPPQPPLP